MSIKKSYVDTKDGQIHYRFINGDENNIPIVFFHMTASSSASYENLLLALDMDRPLYAVDTPNYGQSFRTDKEPSIEYITNILLEALQNIGINQFHAYGHHTGAMIVTEIAATRPELIASTTLNGQIYITPAEGARLWKMRIEDNPLTHYGSQVMWTWTRVILTDGIRLPTETANREFIETMNAGPNWHWAYRAVFSYDAVDKTAKIQCPIFFVVGRHDLAFRYHMNAVEAFPNARSHIADDFGCYYTENDPKGFAPLLNEFILSVESSYKLYK